jgi:hypothetical protein
MMTAQNLAQNVMRPNFKTSATIATLCLKQGFAHLAVLALVKTPRSAPTAA